MSHSDHGITKDKQAQEQPTDKRRARTAHHSESGPSPSREATRDPGLDHAEKTSASRMMTDKRGGASER
jgi:hypothetical protein